MYASRPFKPLSSLRFLRGCISWMARIFSGSRWIPLDVTKNPRNLPLATPRKNLVRFISTGELVWYRTLFSGLWGDRLCQTFHGNIIDIVFYGLAYMLMEDHTHSVLICRSSIFQAKGLCSNIFPEVSWEMCAIHLQGTSLFGSILKNHPWRTSSQNRMCCQS